MTDFHEVTRWVLLSVIVISTVLGDLLQSYEMKRSGAQKVTARGLARLLRIIASRKFLILSVFCMAVSFFAFMALLQKEPLSFAVPASAATFVCETILARFVLNEAVGKRRAGGALLVLGGVILLSR
jgi:drug/metabolite transporter (DMT)-like permease